MTSRDFCYWLQGYLEISSAGGGPMLSGDQLQCIQKHLGLVFHHEIDPSFGPPEKQKPLNAMHHDSFDSNVKVRC